jgi:lysophospholipase
MDREPGFHDRYQLRVLPFYRSGQFGEFSGVGGLKIRYAAFEKENSSGALVVLPGKTETYLKYAELFYDLQQLPLNVYAMDHRGMGFSERMLPDRLKVHVDRFEHYVEDLGTFVEQIVEAEKQERLFVLGHSVGSLIAALYLENEPGVFQAGVLCSPFFGLRFGPVPGFLLRALARLLDCTVGHEQYAPGQKNIRRPTFENNTITHSYERWVLWEQETVPNNEAIHFGGVTNHWLRESLAAGHRAIRGAGKIKLPVLLLQAGEDSLVSAGAQRRFCRRANRCCRIRIREARHEILIERQEIRAQAIGHIKRFLKLQLGQA